MSEIKDWDNLKYNNVTNSVKQNNDIIPTEASKNMLYGSGKPYRLIIRADLRKDDANDTNK